jgi:RimJ/RimL family protein N-acetyltransferase
LKEGAGMECKIRHWKVEDATQLAKALNNRNIQNNLRDGLPYPYTENDAKDFIKAMLDADKDKTFAFAITFNNTVIGSIGIFRKDNIHFRTAEMGYYIAEPFWGKGLGTSAIMQICHYVFDHTNIIRIFAEPFAYNTASCRILEKNGFKYEGTLRSNAEKNGNILDMKMYSLIKK